MINFFRAMTVVQARVKLLFVDRPINKEYLVVQVVNRAYVTAKRVKTSQTPALVNCGQLRFISQQSFVIVRIYILGMNDADRR